MRGKSFALVKRTYVRIVGAGCGEESDIEKDPHYQRTPFFSSDTCGSRSLSTPTPLINNLGDRARHREHYGDGVLFNADTPLLILIISLIIAGFIAAGVLTGRRLRRRTDVASHRESLGVVQGALLGLVGLLLAFGLTMAVGRYESRRALLVDEANAIGTTHLRAQLLSEPERSESLVMLQNYADLAIDMSKAPPDSPEFDRVAAEMDVMQRDLWRFAGSAIAAAPQDNAPRLYVETLNELIDRHTDRTASLRNRVPDSVWILQILGSAIALGALALYLAVLGRGLVTPLIAGVFVILILFNSFDLDRPRRGFIHIPADPLIDVRATMDLEPAAAAP